MHTVNPGAFNQLGNLRVLLQGEAYSKGEGLLKSVFYMGLIQNDILFCML